MNERNGEEEEGRYGCNLMRMKKNGCSFCRSNLSFAFVLCGWRWLLLLFLLGVCVRVRMPRPGFGIGKDFLLDLFENKVWNRKQGDERGDSVSPFNVQKWTGNGHIATAMERQKKKKRGSAKEVTNNREKNRCANKWVVFSRTDKVDRVTMTTTTATCKDNTKYDCGMNCQLGEHEKPDQDRRESNDMLREGEREKERCLCVWK